MGGGGRVFVPTVQRLTPHTIHLLWAVCTVQKTETKRPFPPPRFSSNRSGNRFSRHTPFRRNQSFLSNRFLGPVAASGEGARILPPSVNNLGRRPRNPNGALVRSDSRQQHETRTPFRGIVSPNVFLSNLQLSMVRAPF